MIFNFRTLFTFGLLLLGVFFSPSRAFAAATSVLTFGSNGSGNGQFTAPNGVAVNISSGQPTSGHIYVADYSGARVQEFDSAGVFVRSIDTFSTGSGPYSLVAPEGVAVNSSTGDVYVTDNGGGSGTVVVLRFDADGDFLGLWDGCGSGYCFNIVKGIAVNQSTGHVYVSDYQNAVTEYQADGTFVRVIGSFGSGDGQYIESNFIAVDSVTGAIYLTDTGFNRVTKFDSSGAYVTKWTLTALGGVAVNANGVVYVSDQANSVIRVYNTSGTQIDSWGTAGSGVGQLSSPAGLAIGATGHVFVADRGNHRIQEFFDANASPTASSLGPTAQVNGSYTASTQPQLSFTITAPLNAAGSSVQYQLQVSDRASFDYPLLDYTSAASAAGNFTFTVGQSAGSGSYTVGSVGQKLGDGSYYWRVRGVAGPYGVANSGAIAFNVDATAPVVTKTVSALTTPQFLRTWGSSGSGEGQFHGLQPGLGIATDSWGNVYVADVGNSRVQKFSASGTYLFSWGSNGSGNGQFARVGGIAVDSTNYIYVVDQDNNRVQKFTSGGAYVTQFGSLGSADGELDTPIGVAIDSDDNVHVTDNHNARISVFYPDGSFKTTWGVWGTGVGQFSSPVAIASTSDGYIYVGDNSLNRVQKYTDSGAYVSVFGGAGSGDGQMAIPTSLAVDSHGFVYVAERNNHRVQVFNSSGSFITKWGTSGSSTGQFTNPQGVAVSSTGHVYVFDAGNTRVQQFGYTTTPTTTSPSDDATPTWNWDTYADNFAGLATPAYAPQWSTDSSFGSGVSSGTAATAAYTHTTDLSNGTWYLRVSASDVVGNTAPHSATGSNTVNVAVSTATPTPAPAAHSEPRSSQASSSETRDTTECAVSSPQGISEVFQVDRNGSVATLYVTPGGDPYNSFLISYGVGGNTGQYAEYFSYEKATGVMLHEVRDLDPNSTYSFRVQPMNGCMAGEWSNTLTAGIKNGKYFKYGATQVFVRTKSVVAAVKNLVALKNETESTNSSSTTTQPSATPAPATTTQPSPIEEPANSGGIWGWVKKLFQ